MSLYTRNNLHDTDLVSVTSEESWTSATGTMTKTQKDDLINRMATFVLSLESVDAFIPRQQMLKPLRAQLQKDLCALFDTSLHITVMQDFVQPLVLTSGKDPAGYHGKGQETILALLENSMRSTSGSI